ncbi:MAG: GGDEF domain-containing protein [Trueperaceae bacterium]
MIPSWTGVAALKRRIYLIVLPLAAVLAGIVGVSGFLEPGLNTRFWWLPLLVAMGLLAAWGAVWSTPERMRGVERSLLAGGVGAWLVVLASTVVQPVPDAGLDVHTMVRVGMWLPAVVALAYLSLPVAAATVVAIACWSAFVAGAGVVLVVEGGVATPDVGTMVEALLVHAIAIVMIRGLVQMTYGTQVRADRWESVAATDALTELPNRRAAEEYLRREVGRAERNGENLSVVWLDLDHFKDLNDQHGHEAGDAVLRMVGEALVPVLRGHDFLARWGGEEFVAILPGQDRASAARTAERLRATLEAHPMERAVGASVRVTASFGVAWWRAGEQPRDVLRRADMAMYDAKERGRNRVATSEPAPEPA